jgi:hypothetical protein
MKLQLQAQALRLRLDERELGALLAGSALTLRLGSPEQPLLDLQVTQASTLQFEAAAAGVWRLQLPAAELRAYADTLPRRDALSLPLGGALVLDFEVDVRDSLRERGPKRRAERPPAEG